MHAVVLHEAEALAAALEAARDALRCVAAQAETDALRQAGSIPALDTLQRQMAELDQRVGQLADLTRQLSAQSRLLQVAAVPGGRPPVAPHHLN